MARIPESELDRLKREVSLVRLVESSGIALKQHGKDYLGLCPFHDDKEPSLVISCLRKAIGDYSVQLANGCFPSA